MTSYELLGALDALYDVNDRMGVELMGASVWNGLKKAVAQTTGKALTVSKVANNPKNLRYSSGSNVSAKTANFSVGGHNFKIDMLSGTDALTRELFGFNDEMGEELLGKSVWGKIKDGVTGATHAVLNAGSKVPYISNAVSDIRSVANIFKKSSSANDTANAAISNVSAWVQANKLKTALIVGGVGVGAYLLLKKKKRA